MNRSEKMRIKIKESWKKPDVRSRRLIGMKKAFDLIRKPIPDDKVFCRCGCGKIINKFDNRRRIRLFVHGHNIEKGDKSRLWKGGAKNDRDSIEYRKWRMDVWKRDNFTCQMCFRKYSRKDNLKIEAHHISYWKDNKLSRFLLANGVTLCKKCHKQIHFGPKNRKI